MRIGISARGITNHIGGAKEMIVNITRELAKIESEHEIVVFVDNKSEFADLDVEKVYIPKVHNLIWDHILLPLKQLQVGIDVCLYFKYIKPIWTPAKSAVYVLDLGYLMPGLNAYKFLDTLYMRTFMPISFRFADLIMGISRNTRQDVLRLFRIRNQDKVNFVHLDASYRADEVPEPKYDVLEKYGVPTDKPYIFLSSSLSPRKNLERSILALARISEEVPHNFVITGGKNWGKNSINALLDAHNLADRFFKLGFVDDEDLPHIYKNADVYLHPSLYEGFSMTLLEAIYANLPIVVSNVSSHPEVVGDAGVYFDPYDVDELAEALKKVCLDKDLRKSLIEKGQKRKTLFSWEKSARKTLKLLENLE